MKKIRLGELFDFQSKSKILAKEGKPEGKYAFYTSSPILSKFLDHYQFHGENLIFGTGGNASVHYNNKGFAVSTDCLVAKPLEHELFNVKYVYYYLKNNIHVLEKGFRGAGLRHVSKAFIENIIIPFPSFSTQNQIVAVIDKVVAIIDNSDDLLKKLEELKESIYFHSFGAKATDYDTWESVRLETLVFQKEDIRTGPFGSNLLHDEFQSTGDVLVLGLDNVASNYFIYRDRFISKKKYEELKRYRVYPRDLLIALMGTGTTGKTSVAPDDIPLAVNTKHLATITLDRNVANPYYISSVIQYNPSVINQIELKNKGAVIPGINLTVIKGLKIKLPPVEMQNAFERKIRKIEDVIKSKISQNRNQAVFLLEVISYHSFQNKLETNIDAFDFDDQVVDFIERQSNEDSNSSNDQFHKIKQLIMNLFSNEEFTFSELEHAIIKAGIDIEYDYPIPQRKKGLRDFVFDSISSSEENMPFLKQVFKLDEKRDAEKGIDDSKIIFVKNN